MVIQVTALWNKLVEKIRGATRPSHLEEKRTKRSLEVTPPTFPETPQPKARPKDRYTVLVLPESGEAKQVALSKSRLKILAAISASALVFLAIVAFGMVKYFSRQHLAAVSSVTAVSQPAAPSEQPGTRPIQTPAAPTNKTDSPGAQTPAPPQDASQPRAAALPEESAESAQTGNQKAAPPIAKDQSSPATSPDASTAAASQPVAEPFVINFDAQQVTATVETPNTGH